jgi:glycosyltransferase involved in cell wall biosynthesis
MILEAVQDGKVMQDFESESFVMGGDHSQKVKAPPITNDYGSKDCVNLPSSTASRMKPEIDILLATYNGEKYIRDQIDSILKQSYSNFRLIVRDDGSTDGTKAILEEYVKKCPGHVVLLEENRNLGVKGNFSRLMEASQAPYILFCDQDDHWLEHKVEVTLNKMRELETLHGAHSPLLVHTDLIVANEKLVPIHHSFWRYAKLFPYKARSLNRLLVQNAVTGCTTMINKPLLLKSSPIPNEAIMHDWWVALVAAAFGQIGIVDVPTLYYRQHGKNSLGAIKFDLLSFIKKGIKQIQKGQLQGQSNRRQGDHFLKRYHRELNGRQKKVIEAFLSLNSYPFLKSKYTIIKYRLFRQGIIRNLAMFAPIFMRR